MAEFKIPSSHDVIEIRGLKVRELNMLASRKAVTEPGVIDRVLQECVVTEGIDVRELLLGDRTALLIAIRVATHGPLFDFRAQCPFCARVSYYREDLSRRPVKYLEPPLPLGEERLYEFRLPKCGSLVKYRHLRGKDEPRLRGLQASSQDAIIQALLRARVVEVDGERMVPPKWFDELDAADAAALFADMEEHDCGVELDMECDCPHCGSPFVTQLPILSLDFFLPTRRAPSTSSPAA